MVMTETAEEVQHGNYAPLALAIHSLKSDEVGRLIAACLHTEIGGLRVHQEAVVAILDAPPRSPANCPWGVGGHGTGLHSSVWPLELAGCTVGGQAGLQIPAVHL